MEDFKEKQKELYELIAVQSQKIIDWHADIVNRVLKELTVNGYVDAKAYMYIHFKADDTYETVLVDINDKDLKDEKRNDDVYNFLRKIINVSVGDIIGFVFTSEGTTVINDRPQPFLVVTFENKLRGRKAIYKFTKQTVVSEGGASKLKIIDPFFDETASLAQNSKGVEKFAHVLRYNFDEKFIDIYN